MIKELGNRLPWGQLLDLFCLFGACDRDESPLLWVSERLWFRIPKALSFQIQAPPWYCCVAKRSASHFPVSSYPPWFKSLSTFPSSTIQRLLHPSLESFFELLCSTRFPCFDSIQRGLVFEVTLVWFIRQGGALQSIEELFQLVFRTCLC